MRHAPAVRRAPAVWLLACAWALNPVATTHAQEATSLFVFGVDDEDQALAQYLARSFQGARLRTRLSETEVAALRKENPDVSVLVLSLAEGALTAWRPSERQPQQRRFDSRIVRQSPFALAVAASELLALPLMPPPAPVARVKEPVESVAAPRRFGFRAGAGYVVTLSRAPEAGTTTFHRPALEVGARYKLGRWIILATVRGEPGGRNTTAVQNEFAEALRVDRHSVRGLVGLRYDLADRFDVSLLASAGWSVTRATVLGAAASPPTSERHAGVFGGELRLGSPLVYGFRLEASLGLGADGRSERLLVRGEPVASDGPLIGLAHLGLVWESG